MQWSNRGTLVHQTNVINKYDYTSFRGVEGLPSYDAIGPTKAGNFPPQFRI